MTDEIVYATMAFVFMGYLLDKTGVLDRLIDLLNSLIGGVKGGPAWVSTVASAGLGGVVHNQAAIAATVGSVTIPVDGKVPARQALGRDPRGRKRRNGHHFPVQRLDVRPGRLRHRRAPAGRQ